MPKHWTFLYSSKAALETDFKVQSGAMHSGAVCGCKAHLDPWVLLLTESPTCYPFSSSFGVEEIPTLWDCQHGQELQRPRLRQYAIIWQVKSSEFMLFRSIYNYSRRKSHCLCRKALGTMDCHFKRFRSCPGTDEKRKYSSGKPARAYQWYSRGIAHIAFSAVRAMNCGMLPKRITPVTCWSAQRPRILPALWRTLQGHLQHHSTGIPTSWPIEVASPGLQMRQPPRSSLNPTGNS